jgi:HlyD family secretion protein
MGADQWQSIKVKTAKQHWLTPDEEGSGSESASSRKAHQHRKPVWVLMLPVLFLIGVAAVFGYAFRERLLPGIPVEFVPAMATPNGELDEAAPASASPNASGQLLFQATGWLEPDPLPIRVTPLYSGVAREVHVLEGQTVTNGQLLVTLVDDDAKLGLRRAVAELTQAKALEQSLQAQLKLAQTRQETAARQHESETAQLAERADAAKRLRSLKPGTLPEQERVQADLREQSQAAKVAAAAAAVEEWKAESTLVKQQIEVQRQQIAAAEVARDEAKLAVSRTLVRSPVDGVVLRLLATPGKRLMLNMDHPDASTAAILYEPDKLQARVDVPLADAGKLAVGQSVQVTCSLLPDKRFKAVVTRIVGEADRQRNTLQAKVRIHNPDPRLRPEMLCRAEFHGLLSGVPPGGSSTTAAGPLTVYVPSAAVVDRNGQEAGIWVVSADNRHAERRDVRLGSKERNGDLSVPEGVRPGERVIINPPSTLNHGARIKPLEARGTFSR